MEVKPVKPPAPWLGGKSRLAPTILSIIDEIDHKCYAEPFVGMGGIFLRRSNKSKAEVINDYNQDVINLFRILQKHINCLLDMFQWQLTSRAEFQRLTNTNPKLLTDIERAARFLYILKASFGGMGRSFGVDSSASARFNIVKLRATLAELHERLTGVSIECLHYADFIEKYDKKYTLFYLDPPYYGHENDYGKNMFDKADFDRLAAILRGIEGKFILSLNDVKPVHEIFKDFAIEKVKTTYTVARNGNAKANEVIIHNLSSNLKPKIKGK
ncbi:DNA adenine methylase [Flavobacterium sp. 3HN19-14]|uniref:DNA adenine methylase n=1 Tax=Flavobacterium sp. 3HN19-14 TaxID=3448133 RepID=UPI003EE30197